MLRLPHYEDNEHLCYGIPVAERGGPHLGDDPGFSTAPGTPDGTPDGALVGTTDEGLSDAFWAVARRLRHLSRETLGPIDITPGQSRALRVLDRDGPIRLNTLADQLRIAPRSATEVVDILEERGLAERRPDPHDRRATLVALTAEGRRLGGLIRTARRTEAERLFGGLSPSDRRTLARILGQLLR
jgi:DNA-binding MarR family transcriptional regulator